MPRHPSIDRELSPNPGSHPGRHWILSTPTSTPESRAAVAPPSPQPVQTPPPLGKGPYDARKPQGS